MRSLLLATSLFAFFCFAATGNAVAQESGRFSADIKATRLPEVGASLHFSENLSIRALAGIETSLGDEVGGIGNLSLLYRLGAEPSGLTNYVGAGVTNLGFEGGNWFLGVLYGLRFEVSERLGVFGEAALDVGEQRDEAVFSLINNTGIGVSYRF